MGQKTFWNEKTVYKDQISIAQINLGNRCNQNCTHCHIAASPKGNKNMNSVTAEKIMNKLSASDIRDIEFTGGAPELNNNLKIFVENLSKQNKNLIVRTNLTALDLSECSFYINLFKRNKVKLIASLPNVFKEIVDKQRGNGVFNKSIKVLRKLNKIGYGTNGLSLDIVYNPIADFLPPDQTQIENDYKQGLKDKYDIYFNNLITIVNSPIKRFKKFLKREGQLNNYIELLKKHYNPATLDNIMCRKLISVDYAGDVYDCDFNLALNRKIKNWENIKFWDINFNNFRPTISCDNHCYACTANRGSSCHGVLIKDFDVKKNVKEYYGEKLQKTSDLKTNACCTVEAIPERIKSSLSLIYDEIKMKYYGCGSPIPIEVKGLKVLDVGCGTGRDCYIMSRLVGEKGMVYGIDMTKNQIDVAQKYVKNQTVKFGYKKPNIKFIRDYIENIGKHFEDEYLDIVMSNCVINLTEDKEAVLKQVCKILKFGGEFYFSDIYTDRRSPDPVRKNPILYGECLGGALYYKDFDRIARKVGFTNPRVISKREVKINNPNIKSLVGNIKFYSITYRLWKLKGLEDACEDYGHIAIYNGGIPESPFKFELDDVHVFYKGKPERVCGNTALMLSQTRFKKFFVICGGFNEHFGEFKDCSNVSKDDTSNSTDGGCCE